MKIVSFFRGLKIPKQSAGLLSFNKESVQFSFFLHSRSLLDNSKNSHLPENWSSRRIRLYKLYHLPWEHEGYNSVNTPSRENQQLICLINVIVQEEKEEERNDFQSWATADCLTLCKGHWSVPAGEAPVGYLEDIRRWHVSPAPMTSATSVCTSAV